MAGMTSGNSERIAKLIEEMTEQKVRQVLARRDKDEGEEESARGAVERLSEELRHELDILGGWTS